MKTYLFIFALLFLTFSKASATGVVIIGGKPAFETACGSCTPIVPLDWEVSLSTCLYVVIDGKVELGFDNYSDWLDCQTKAGLRRKYRKIQALTDSFGALPASLTTDLKERAGWLRSYYLSLP